MVAQTNRDDSIERKYMTAHSNSKTDSAQVSQPRTVHLPVVDSGSVDVAVVGGGMAGVFAALAAADRGARTLLLEQHAFVGGQGTAGGVHTFCGETRVVNDNWSEMLERLEALSAVVPYRADSDARAFDIESLKYVLQEMLAARGVRILLHTSLVGVDLCDGRVVELTFFNKSGLQRIGCRYVIDASGDADVVARAGLPFLKGGAVYRPGADGPERVVEAGQLQLPMSLYFAMVDTGEPVRAVLPEGCPQWETTDDLPMTTVKRLGKNLISVKMKVIGHDATDGLSLSDAEQRARRQMMGLVYHLQTKGTRKEPFSTWKLAWVSPHIGIREGRRVVGRQPLSDDDLFCARRFADGVAVGSYHLDYHWPDVLQRAGGGITGMVPPYQIPLGALRPCGVDNLLVPGRCVSGEQLAMSSYRVMGTCAATGHAAGVVAGLATRDGVGIDGIPVATLQRELRSTGVRLDQAPYENYHRRRRYFKEHVFPVPATFAPSHHASTLVQLPDGDILCAWFGGTKEGHPDVGIWLSRRSGGVWGEPRRLIAPQGMACYNPVLFLADTDRLHPEIYGSGTNRVRVDECVAPRLLLYYRVGTSAREWTTFVVESNDGGHNWSQPAQMADGLCGPIKNNPIILANGDWVAAGSWESEQRNYCVVERSVDGGRSWTASAPLEHPDLPLALIQPAIWESDPGHVHILMRNRAIKEYGTPATIWRADSTDGGRTWSAPYPTDLPSNDSGLDIARAWPSPGDPGSAEGESPALALVFNPVATASRSPLAVWISYDNGKTWPQRAIIEDDPDARAGFCYPSIIPCAAGFLLSYTWKRQGIVCMRFCPGHVEDAAANGSQLDFSSDALAAVRAVSSS